MAIAGFDHAAIPVADMDAMLQFYRALGCTVDATLAPHLYAVHFGPNKLNLHAPGVWQSGTFTLRGPAAVPGCGDFCFVWDGSQLALDTLISNTDAAVVEGPVERTGGRGDNGQSTYIRDPDGNLLEFIIY